MHKRGFVHADIKPGNILVTERDEVKIIDLGQACATGTVKKRIQGTPGYMAPEQAHRQTITDKTDGFVAAVKFGTDLKNPTSVRPEAVLTDVGGPIKLIDYQNNL